MENLPENAENKDSIEQEEVESKIKDNAKYLEISFRHILQLFHKNVSDSVLYANFDINKEPLTVQAIVSLSRKLGLKSEMRRINLFDIHSGPAILLLSENNSCVLEDNNLIFQPKTQSTHDFNPAELNKEYNGYALFFYEEDLSVSSFIKRTGFLFSSISNFKPIFVEILILSFFINIFIAVSPFYTMNVYDKVIPNYAFSTLFVLSFGMLLVYLFDLLFKIIKGYLTDYISLSIGSEVDHVLLNKILSVKAPGITMSNGAKNSLFKELSMVREFYFSRFIPMLIDMPFLILFLIVLMFISPWLMIVPLVASIIIFIINIMLQVPLQNAHKFMMTEEQQKSSLLTETLSGGESIKTFNAVGKVLYKWRRILDKTYRVSFSYNLWVNISSNISLFIMNAVGVMIMIVGVFEVSYGVMTTGGLIASSTLSSRIMSTVATFSGMIVRYRSVQNTLHHLEKVVNQKMEDDTASYGQKGPFKGDIKFKDVSFFYPELRNPILNKVSFNIKAGTKVAIIGKTGAGKSTITRILLGLDFANKGQIFIDDIDINNIHINELRANIGFMPQKSYFFSGTVRENILLNNQGVISEEKYKRACELAGVNLITSLSAKGDDMMVNEGGSNLSGGQQQIMALARAIINDPEIIIMDEPTNGMDVALEATFMNKTKEFIKDKTFILITHKPAQLSLVDRVIVIDNAQVVMEDTKENVIAALSKNRKTDDA
jgi:ATP-binding cassette subfamily C protein LapB